MKKRKFVIVGCLILFVLIASVSSTSAIGSKGAQDALVIRADRIESKDLLLGLGSSNHGLVLNLKIGESRISGMKMGGSYSQGQGRWQVNIQNPGLVTIHGLSVDVSAIGFKIKPGDLIRLEKNPLEIGSLTPSIVLHDVYLRVERMEAGDAGMPSLELDATKPVSLTPPKGGIFIDLRTFSSMSKEDAEEQINQILSNELNEAEDEEKQGEDGDRKEPGGDRPDDGDLPKGENPPDPSDESPVPNPGEEETPGDEPVSVPGNDGAFEQTVKLKRYFTALEIVQKAKEYDSEIILKQGDKKYDAKNWGRVIRMIRFRGTETKVIAEGADAKDAVRGMAEFLAKE